MEGRPKLNITWNVRDVFISIIMLVILLVGIYFGTVTMFGTGSTEEALEVTNISNFSFTLLYGIQVLLMIGVVWFFAIFWRKASLKDLGFRYYSILKTLWYTFLSLIGIFALSFLYVFAMNSFFGIEAPSSKVEQLVRSGNISSNILLVVVTVIAPLSEELFFRGYLYSACKKTWGVSAGLFLSSFFFAIAHLEIYSFIPIFIIGWILAYIFEKTKSLFPVIFLHAVYNLILILIMLGQVEMVKMY